MASENPKGLWKLTVAGSWMNWVESWFAVHWKEDRVGSLSPTKPFSKRITLQKNIRESRDVTLYNSQCPVANQKLVDAQRKQTKKYSRGEKMFNRNWPWGDPGDRNFTP